MTTYFTKDVFTPTVPAKLAFVEREVLNQQVIESLETPGKQIVVYGQSGSGKSTLLTNKVAQVYGPSRIVSRCTVATTFENLLLSAFDQLEVFYASGASIKTTSTITGKLEGTYLAIKSSVEAASSAEKSSEVSRLLPPQLTPQRLAEFCGAAGCCWILEDFHKVPESEKVKLSQIMKVFTDVASELPKTKIVAIGAVDTARQVIQYDPEMRTRIAEIAVPMMTIAELTSILEKGEKLLNINFGIHKAQIATYSSGLGAICHQIALNICNSAVIKETCTVEQFFSTDNFKQALERYLSDSSDTLKTVFDIALKQERAGTFENTKLIVQALSLSGQEGAAHAEILKRIRVSKPNYPSSNLTNYLRELQKAKRGTLIRSDSASGRFFFSDPLYHAYAQCLFVPPKEASIISGSLFGEKFNVQFFVDRWLSTKQREQDKS